MKINADFGKVAAVHSGQLPWTPSPMAGVDRRMLDRIGDEIARATSLVQYAPGSQFSAHTHSGGEEFIVLEGTFQDEHADYPTGTYVRNPIGTRHIPRADDGCTIFVKLWQFDHDDTDQFAVDLNQVELVEPDDVPGIARHILHETANEVVTIEAWASGAIPRLHLDDGAELFILEGSVRFREEEYGRHDWIRLPPGSSEAVVAGYQGTRVWIKTGHLGEIARSGWRSPQQD